MTAMYSPSVLPEDDDDEHHHHHTEARDDDVNDEELPSEAQLVLLCLDHLRELRRSYYSKEDLQEAEGIDADYLSVAIYALSRCFTQAPELSNQTGNDCNLDRERANELTPGLFPVQDPPSSKNFISVPNLQSINQEIFYPDPQEEYIYQDSHASNAHRFYPLDGLASGPSLRGPLTLGELTVAGLAGLGARSRQAAEEDVRESPLFDQFVAAVRSKGFFRDPDTERPRSDPEDEKERLRQKAALEEERLQKVMGKVRTKLANKAQQQLDDHEGEVPPLYDDYLVMTAAERLERRRIAHVQQLQHTRNGDAVRGAPPKQTASTSNDALFRQALSSSRSSPTRGSYSVSPTKTTSPEGVKGSSNVSSPTSEDHQGLQVVTSSSTIKKNNRSSEKQQRPYESPATPSATKLAMSTPRSAARTPQDNPADVQEAERLKAIGNTHMQRKQYVEAAEAYTEALTLSPNGPYTHVYYSNRAAALLSMKKFEQAIADSERSLALKPDYGKAHARLGLAHFLLGNYRLAVEAYTISLKYEPDNKSTKNYLEKAAKRAAAMEESNNANQATSFSFVSELDRSDSKRQSQMASIQEGEQQQDQQHKQRSREKEAEKLKLRGNSHMANRDYEAALMNYTAAIKLAPDGPNSHVYYSNRAAALCYLERYEEAEADSEHSLMLVPTYGKAHARLGLSRFFMGDYSGAIEAYTAALEFDPDNAASKSYLAKARARLAKQSETRARRPEPVVTDKDQDSLDEIMDATLTPASKRAAEI